MHLVYLSESGIVDVFVVARSCSVQGAQQRSETIESGHRFFSFCFLFASGKLCTQAACEAQLLAPSN